MSLYCLLLLLYYSKALFWFIKEKKIFINLVTDVQSYSLIRDAHFAFHVMTIVMPPTQLQ